MCETARDIASHEGVLPDNSFYCWPSVCITSSGGAGKVEALEAMPTDPAEARHPGYFAWRFVPVTAKTSILSVVNEDRDVCNRVQRAHDSGVGELGTLITAIDSEYHTQVWERLLHRALAHPEEPLYAPMLDPADTGRWRVTRRATEEDPFHGLRHHRAVHRHQGQLVR